MTSPADGHRQRIEVVGAGKVYGDYTVFEGIDLDVGSREIVSIVGPSGCGKTTLLRCLNGLIPLTHGSVSIDGERVTAPRTGVAMVFQHFGLFPWKTVSENVGYGLKIAGKPPKQIAGVVQPFIDLVGLTGFEKHYPYQLSGGMQQRAGLARALAIEPNVLLMDEPFSAVDAQTREILQFELLRIWDSQPTSMVFVTHSIEEAVLMGDRVVVLKGCPSTIQEVIDVGITRPRNRTTVGSERFIEIREHVWGILMDDIRRAERDVEAGAEPR
ncbi:MAG TPA: ABC transporter ATP-binding protein [Acidimicrobiia bacterium]|nr:ABC transporter ATP-binding protein [Acidimicrobiia bacterium]